MERHLAQIEDGLVVTSPITNGFSYTLPSLLGEMLNELETEYDFAIEALPS